MSIDQTRIMALLQQAGFHRGETNYFTDSDPARFVKFAELVSAAQREVSAKACEAHAKEPQMMRVTEITDSPRRVVAFDCAELVRTTPL